MHLLLRNVRGHVGLVDAVAPPSTLICPCVATLGGPWLAIPVSPSDRAVCNLLIIFIHSFLPFAVAGSSLFISFTRSAVASNVWHLAVLWVEGVGAIAPVLSRCWNVEIQYAIVVRRAAHNISCVAVRSKGVAVVGVDEDHRFCAHKG